VATKKPSRPFYDVFLERVIRIDAVQRHRAGVTDEYAAQFFSAGRLLGELDDFCWSLDEPELFSRRGTVQILGVISPRGDFIPNSSGERTVSPAMRAAWDAAVAAWRAFVSALRNGEYIATATHPATGERRDLEPAEWMRTGLVLDVRNGKRTVRWSAIVVQARKLGAIDWDAEWNEDVARREKDQLPNEKAYVGELERRIKGRYGVTSVDGGDLRQFKAALYRGDPVRPRKR